MTEDVDKLIKALSGEDEDRYSAAEALGKIGDTRAVEPLIDMLYRTDSHRLVYSAANALGGIGDTRAVEPFIKVLSYQDHDHRSLISRFPRRGYEIHEAVTSVLVDFGEPAVEPLIKALGDESNVRDVSVEALRAIGGPRAMEALGKLLEDPEQLRIEALVEALVNDDEFISRDALEPLIRIGEPAVEPLIGAAMDLLNGITVGQNTDEGWGLWQIANVLGGIGDARAVEVLIEILSDGYACDGAVNSLVSIGKPAVEPLIEALGDEDEDVRSSAAGVLGKIGNARAVEPLIELLSDDGWGVSDAAKEALEKLGHEIK